jgi:hypothetical protein
MRNYLAALVAAIALVSGGTAALAQPPTAGMLLTGTLGSTIDTKNAYAGEDVALNNVSSSDGSIRDATLTGTVTSVQRAGQGQPGKIQLRFDTLRMADGQSYSVDTTVTQMQSQTKNNILKEAGGALAGMLVGNAVTKTLFGIAGGGLIGAAGGFLIAKNNRQDVTIPANSTVTVQVVGRRRQAY